ncbi:MAG: tetratricopeptide repeat protein [Candidatus Hodarchaeota archaeon]
MVRRSEGSLEQLWRAEELMTEGKVDAARSLINALEGVDDLPPDAFLTWKLLKSQLLIIMGDLEASHQLAAQLRQTSLDRGQLLQGVDGSIAMAEALVELGDLEASANAIAEGEQLLTAVADEAPAVLSQRKASFIYLRGRICLYKAESDKAMDYFQQSLALRQELGNKHDIAISLRNIGVVHGYKGSLDQALEYHQQALKLFQEVGNKARIAICLTNIGGYLQGKGELDPALEHCQQGLALFQEIGSNSSVAYSLGILAGIHHAKGELDCALDHYQQKLTIVEELGNKWSLADCLFDIGWLDWHRGELDRALEHFQHALALGQELDNKFFIANTLGSIGLIHWQKGALEQALLHLEDDLRYHEKLDHNIQVGFCLFWLILVSLDLGSSEQAQQYLKQLQHINEQEDHKGLSQVSRLAQALTLKASLRIRDKAKAQELFQQLVEEEVVHFLATKLAMINLCELLLDELKAYGEVGVFQEAKSLVDKLYAFAQTQHSFSLVINALILKAKFAMVEGDLAVAAQYLEQAKVTADEKGLGRLAEIVSAEKQQLGAQYAIWEQLIQRNASFRERVEQARINDYLKDIEKLVSPQSLELPS